MRNLEREIANVCRKVARRVIKEGRNIRIQTSPEDLKEYLGVSKSETPRPKRRTRWGWQWDWPGQRSGANPGH